MNFWDIIIIVVYSVGLLSLGYFFKEQKDTKDYFLGGRSFGWFELGLSTMATQLSAISFISASAFVGLREGGGMKWLSYEFAVPLAMIFLMLVLIPPLYKAGIISIYQFLENRYSRSTRVLISIVFQFSRAFSTGILIYAVALVLSAVLEIPIWATILMAGVITLIYSYQGGMKAVVWGDAIQMIILFAGILICTGYGIYFIGGWGSFTDALDYDRLTAVDFSNWGIGEGEEFGFWPMVLGGFFLYASYYGTDQSQAQRALSASSMKTVRSMLMFNGLARFPITFAYCTMGLVVGTYAFSNPDFMGMIPSDKPDLMMPLFIANYLPNGILGLLIVAILAAAMSSLSSAINSLSAATVEDIIVKNVTGEMTPERHLRLSKTLTLFWGAVCIILAFAAGNIAATIIEAINKVGSLFYGPILATFIMAMTMPRTNTRGVNIGLISGVLVNLGLWLFAEELVFWFWWNFSGAAVTFLVGLLASILIKSTRIENTDLFDETINLKVKEAYLLAGYFVIIVLFSLSLATVF